MSKPQFVYVSYIETTPEKLWEALTSSEFTKQYWFGAEVRSDWKIDSPFALLLDGEITDSGEILQADPPRLLSYSFKHHKFAELRGEPISRVVFTIEPFGSLVRLTVLHDGFVEGGKYLGAVSNGWPAILSQLKSLLETGKLLGIPRAALNKGFDAK
ncbi:SRPBCC family protein [Bradyrhizobium sp. KB893862 SZCCT0404]|uniref:SRPBCC family protein n=1 Tax=Bradyrhizobium sp. KB893862 SZCCT0404 TaxID=2807672 RepID=UPI001BA8D57C|nr:SRPBCC family protein [Bradyrhizobium sp. KB893862 SZCCT0404]MBR1178963.1 SRPBCC family protein [Bradyrhizobium sp. KB893862 SZCCT0404]